MTAVIGTFTLPLELAAPPARVWRFFAELPLRRSWVRMPGPSSTATHDLDFRPGGHERLTNTFVSGETREELENRTTFYDIVPEERLVFGYEAIVAGILRWVALVTVELAPNAEGAGTLLGWTEQYSLVHLSTQDGVDDVKHLVGGTRLRLNGLALAVAAPEVGA